MVYADKNYLRLEGEEQEINRFVQKARGGNIDPGDNDPFREPPIRLHNLIPGPLEFFDSDGGVENSSKHSKEYIFRYGFNSQDDWCRESLKGYQNQSMRAQREKLKIYLKKKKTNLQEPV